VTAFITHTDRAIDSYFNQMRNIYRGVCLVSKEWDKAELEKLEKLYKDKDVTVDEMRLQLPGRTEDAIRIKANRLGFNRPLTDRNEVVSLSDLKWSTHKENDRSTVYQESLNLIEAIAEVMGNEAVAATGYHQWNPEATISRGK